MKHSAKHSIKTLFLLFALAGSFVFMGGGCDSGSVTSPTANGTRIPLPPASSTPFHPLALRLRNKHNQIVDTVRSTEPFTIEIEYRLDEPVKGLRVGLYLITARGEYVFASFDTDNPEHYEKLRIRQSGHYTSRCVIPADYLNEGRYVLGINASSYRIKRYFQDEQALAFSVDATKAPGMQWHELRVGPVRPRLTWQIERDRTSETLATVRGELERG